MENINLDNSIVNKDFENMKIPKVLIVEDEETERLSLKAALELENFIVDVASDGTEAENKIKKNFFDIVIVDYRLPDIDGINLIKKMKCVMPDLMPIVVTAYTSVEVAIESLKIGAYDYIAKPIDVSNLLKTMKKIIEETKSLLNSKKTLENIITEGNINYVTDKKDIVVVTTPDTSILVDIERRFNFVDKIKEICKIIKKYYWG